MPTLKGHIIAESPIYRGNGLKTLFSRKEKKERTPIELPGNPNDRDAGKMKMDAFIGFKNFKDNRYIEKLFDKLYKRLFGDKENSESFFNEIKIKCSFNDSREKADRFYDLRMGIKLNRDRMSMEENANYKIETVFKGTDFDFSIDYPSTFNNTQKKKLYLLLKELIDGRFWFGAGKTKGLGRLKLQLDKTPLMNLINLMQMILFLKIQLILLK